MRVTWRSAVVGLALVMLGGWFVQQSLAGEPPAPAIAADTTLSPAGGPDDSQTGDTGGDRPGASTRGDAGTETQPRAGQRPGAAGEGRGATDDRRGAKGDDRPGDGRTGRGGGQGGGQGGVEEVTPQPQDVDDDDDGGGDGDDDDDGGGDDDRGDD